MCGIAGYLGKNRFESKNIQKILDTMKWRGPDSRDFKEIYFKKSSMSILDGKSMGFKATAK